MDVSETLRKESNNGGDAYSNLSQETTISLPSEF
jgi:hypothetical protein